MTDLAQAAEILDVALSDGPGYVVFVHPSENWPAEGRVMELALILKELAPADRVAFIHDTADDGKQAIAAFNVLKAFPSFRHIEMSITFANAETIKAARIRAAGIDPDNLPPVISDVQWWNGRAENRVAAQ